MPHEENSDRRLLQAYILLPLVITALERDGRLLARLLRTPAPYVEMAEAAAAAAARDLRKVRLAMRAAGMRVYENERLADGIRVRYQCRGFHGEMSVTDAKLADQAVSQMRRYMGLEAPAVR
ncbi:hypothetical protein F4V43_14355 [Paenibacillus spiritus]|uniref:Uncharacterized protein n=1 Tax=Paenibacillus spiritus TaxID=2496557 RepID=A0A5J5G2Q0_9BACL|nr:MULTISPECIES: hypothetical protein [Paenibacillus]KAA9001020.1 hypothetical protein F4V43_14355 [Paenibacillus spiritus]